MFLITADIRHLAGHTAKVPQLYVALPQSFLDLYEQWIKMSLQPYS